MLILSTPTNRAYSAIRVELLGTALDMPALVEVMIAYNGGKAVRRVARVFLLTYPSTGL